MPGHTAFNRQKNLWRNVIIKTGGNRVKNVIKRLCSATMAVITLITGAAIPVIADENMETEKYTELQSPSVVYNMNIDWKYKRAENGADFPLKVASDAIKDSSGNDFYAIDYDDSDWKVVSVPHAVNAEDSFDGVGVDAGEAGLYRGFMFYRKNIVIPQTSGGCGHILGLLKE